MAIFNAKYQFTDQNGYLVDYPMTAEIEADTKDNAMAMLRQIAQDAGSYGVRVLKIDREDEDEGNAQSPIKAFMKKAVIFILSSVMLLQIFAGY